MILHLVTDEKFTDYAIRQFSAPEMESEFVLIPSNWNPGCEVKYNAACRVIRQGSLEFNELLTHLGDYSAIVLHGLHWRGWQTPILKSVPDHVKVAWVFWGGDLYGRVELNDQFLAPMSKLLNHIHMRGRKVDSRWQIPIALFKRIDYILTDEKEEYEFAKDFIGTDVKFLPYNYYSLSETLGSCYDLRVSGNNIFLGNSATVSNNFFEALLRLRFLPKKERTIIVPLSYGAPWLRNAVTKLGKCLFGRSFYPLLEFIPRDEYNKIMLSCNTMVMNHWNPQAQGNMITGLWLGMKLYMSEHSMTYAYFKRLGLKVYSVEHDLKYWNKELFLPMSEEDIAHNREIIQKHHNKEYTDNCIVNIVNELKTPKYDTNQ